MKVFGSVFILLIKTSVVLACTCTNTSNISFEQQSKYLKDVKVIFYGEVVEIGESKKIVRKYKNGFSLTDTVQPVKYKVLKAWKGVESPEITVETDTLSSCRFVPPLGSKATIYVYENEKSETPFSINQCSVNRFNEEMLKREFGEGKTFEEPEREIQTTESSENFLSIIWQKIISVFS